MAMGLFSLNYVLFFHVLLPARKLTWPIAAQENSGYE